MSDTPRPAGGGLLFPRQYLQRAMERRRLSHAYLLLGPEGSGKLAFARGFAQAFFCREGTSCGACASCRSIEHGNHPGVTVYRSAEGKSTVDIDTVRQLCERSHYTREHVFVAILERADHLTIPAANALLKTLEEPRGDFIVLLTAPSTGGLLPTMISRCHRLYFPWRGVGHDAAGAAETGARVQPEPLAEARAADFHARYDVREWLALVVPEPTGARPRVRELLGALVSDLRRQLTCFHGSDLDRALDSIDRLLELRADLDANVNPDLVLEKAVGMVGRLPGRPA